MADLKFEKSSLIPASAEELFHWHERPGAFNRLTPPWEPVELVSHEGIRDGDRAIISMKLGPFTRKWVAEHSEFRSGESFQDVQISGPFAKWEHTHKMSPIAERESQLTDSIQYRLPGGSLGNLLGAGIARRKLDRMFRYRHRRTRDDLSCHEKYRKQPRMKVVITGGTGLVGEELQSLLSTGGHETISLTRRSATRDDLRQWDPTAEVFDPAWFEGADAVVHLAGENIAGQRWTEAFKKRLWDSRIDVTQKLVTALSSLSNPPRTLISASAIGWYGETGNECVDEQAPAGEGFLADLCKAWEDASHPAREAGIRVVNPRIGIVLSPKGGALAKMLFPFKMGAGGILGNGKQFMSWISLDDVAGAIYHALMTESISGPMNCVAPSPVTNYEFTKTLGRVLNRPTIFPVPGFMAKLAFGEMAEALLLASTRVKDGVLDSTDYEFRTPQLEDCLRHVLGR
ncbi:MAG: TIGR01777 family protein [Planctomycetaceae bacterium]|nr:TIGR01777 family protein [Planctomycetaceae bacterium]